MLENIIRNLLFRFEPETAHYLGQCLIRLRYSRLLTGFNKKTSTNPVQAFGLSFPNPIGLAAGWDKNGTCIDALFRMGFGFVEVGTVTPKPQFGNPKPRLFRIPEKQALINRMGFNNAGADRLVHRLKNRTVPGVLGVNMGKNRDTQLEDALKDYQYCLTKLYPYADYFVINISSPNTPGLRELQTPQYLKALLQGIAQARQALMIKYSVRRPILVKTTVDLPQANYADFLQVVCETLGDGLVISNTTIDHSAVLSFPHGQETGGLSGEPLRERVTKMIADMSVLSQGQLPIIGVGGIVSQADAKAHFEAGASLVQLYTGFVYRGSALLEECVKAKCLISSSCPSPAGEGTGRPNHD